MKKSLILNIFIFFWIVANGQSLGPTVIASTGADLSANGIRISATVGEMAVQTFRNSGKIITQGFQQGPIIFLGVKKDYFSDVKVNVYPNPVSDYVNVAINGEFENAEIQIFDMLGKIIKPPLYYNKISDCQNIRIDLSEIKRGAYLIRVFDNNKKLFSDFKILKVR
ncbi:MAG: T9SS type A sorting domain-containing protein [Bacteroidota bacterium]|nr:T9SS type A sorting domain-containing protein [Bacteroidota bacterium]